MTVTGSTHSPSTAIEPVLRSAIERLTGEKPVTMRDLLKILQPESVNAPVPTKVPAPATITEDQRKALDRLVEVFGQVVPTERRALQPAEVSSLLEEKAALADITKMCTKRTEGIRTTVFNSLDVQTEAGEDFDPETTLRDKDGHYILDGEARGLDKDDEKFVRETREGSPSLDLDRLKALAEDDQFPDFTHKDYLAMTSQVRVVEEAKVMLALKKNPTLVAVIAAASKPGSKTISFNVRKA